MLISFELEPQKLQHKNSCEKYIESDVAALPCLKSRTRTGIHCRALNSKKRAEFTESCSLANHSAI